MADTINYTILKNVDISFAMDSCGKVAKAERSNEKLDGKVWENTVTSIMERLKENQYEAGDTSKDGIAAIRKVLFEEMEKVIYDAKVVIPETGLDRTGKTIVLLNEKTGKTKWSSWDKSRRIFSYLGDISKVLAFGKKDLLYPETNKVAARCDILNACKAEVAPIEHVKRLSEQMNNYLPALEDADKIEGMNICKGLIVPKINPEIEATAILSDLERVLSGADAAQKEAIRLAIVAVASRHFSA